MRAALRLPGFRYLAGGYFVNELGNWLGEIALAVLVFDATDSPLATAGLFVAMQFVPALLTPLLVPRLEGLAARRSLPALYGAEALCFIALAALAPSVESLLAIFLVLAALDGTLAATARSLTRTSAVATLEPAGLLREGNAVLNVGFTAGAAGGPALGGLLVAGAGAQASLLGDAASFLIMATLLSLARQLRMPAVDKDSWQLRIREGIGYLRDHHVLRGLIIAQAIALVFFALVLPIEVVFVKRSLGDGDLAYGTLLASWGVGMVFGSFLFAGLRKVALPKLLAVSTAAVGVAYLFTSVSPTLAVACCASLVGGTGNGIQWVALITAVQSLTEERFQARTIAVLESAGSAMPGVGFLLGGAIAALLSPRASYAVAGCGVLAVLTVAGMALQRGLSAATAEASQQAPVMPARD